MNADKKADAAAQLSKNTRINETVQKLHMGKPNNAPLRNESVRICVFGAVSVFLHLFIFSVS